MEWHLLRKWPMEWHQQEEHLPKNLVRPTEWHLVKHLLDLGLALEWHQEEHLRPMEWHQGR